MVLKDISIKEIQYKLLNKGINKDKIKDYFYNNREELEEYEIKSATNLVQKKQRTMEKEDIKRYLLKKGYNNKIIKEVF